MPKICMDQPLTLPYFRSDTRYFSHLPSTWPCNLLLLNTSHPIPKPFTDTQRDPAMGQCPRSITNHFSSPHLCNSLASRVLRKLPNGWINEYTSLVCTQYHFLCVKFSSRLFILILPLCNIFILISLYITSKPMFRQYLVCCW